MSAIGQLSQFGQKAVERARALGTYGRLPPGPPEPPAIQMARWIAHPSRFMRQSFERYGEVYTMRIAGVPPFVMFSAPEAVKEVFLGSADDLYAGQGNAVLEPFLGSNSVLLLDGDKHMRQRRLLLPPFHGPRMRAYGAAIRDITLASMERWPRDRTFRVHDRTQAITLDVILRTVFGIDEGPEFRALQERLTALLHRIANPALLLPLLQTDYGAWSPGGRLAHDLAAVDELLYAQIRQRKAEGGEGREDVLAMLVEARDEDGAAMTDEELRDELMTLLVAGHETTATSLAWTFYRLLKAPYALRRLHDEIDGAFPEGVAIDPDRVRDLKWLDAVIKETLRLKPVVPAVARRLQRPMRIGGVDLPAGVIAVPNIYLVHRNPRVWRDPNIFDPRRFLDNKPSPYEYFPFGGGIRRCIGMAFAHYEMQVVLATVLQRLTIESSGESVRLVRRAITFAPSGGMPLIVRDR